MNPPITRFTAAANAAIRAAIQADQSLLDLANVGDYGPLADHFNAPATPDCWAWRTNVRRDEITSATSVDATTFTWSGTGAYINRSAAEREAFREVFTLGGTVNMAMTNNRQCFDDVFSGTAAAAVNNRAHIKAIGRRTATRIEKLLATGTGSTADPAVMEFEGKISPAEISLAWTS
jgi:hypothetical protein